MCDCDECRAKRRQGDGFVARRAKSFIRNRLLDLVLPGSGVVAGAFEVLSEVNDGIEHLQDLADR